MLVHDLFEEALLKPMELGNAELYAVSGFASSALANRHFFEHKGRVSARYSLSINLIVGMGNCGGISLNDHHAYQSLINRERFFCRYVNQRPCVHSKVYSWFIDNKPALGFVGSANYTQSAFDNRQGEVLQEADPVECRQYYDDLLNRTQTCDQVPDQSSLISSARGRGQPQTQASPTSSLEGTSRTISFLDRGNRLPERSGLNWGQRPDHNREPNQAYFKIPITDANSGFFPLGEDHFILKMDDGKILICRLEQQNNKALTTPQDNSEIGRYIRSRIGREIGVNLLDRLVEKQHLDEYGRYDVTYTKIDSHTFEGDFSV